MPLLQPKQKGNRLQLRITMPEIIVDEIKSYCQWLQIDKPEDFLEQAALYVLRRDKEWLVAKENQHHDMPTDVS